MAFNSEREEIHRNRIAIRSPNRRSSSLRFSQHFHQILQALRFCLLSISLLVVCFYAFAFLGFQFLMCFFIFLQRRGVCGGAVGSDPCDGFCDCPIDAALQGQAQRGHAFNVHRVFAHGRSFV